MDKALIVKMVELSNLIHQRTVRNKTNWLHVEVGSPFHQAIERGEFIWLGLEPGSGVPIEHEGWQEYNTGTENAGPTPHKG